MPKCKVSRRNLLKTLSGVKDENINIWGIGLRRKVFVEVLKTLDDDVLELSTGMLSWHGTSEHFEGIYQGELENAPCLNVSAFRHTMRFLNSTVAHKPMCKLDLIDFTT